MVDTDIIVPIDKTKQPETVDLAFQGRTERQKFMHQLREEQVRYTEKHQPFCFRCAKIDYEKQQEDLFKEKGKRSGGDRPENVPVHLNLTDYAKQARFTIKKQRDIKEMIVMDGRRVPVTTKKYMEYVCNERGCGHSIEVDIDKK